MFSLGTNQPIQMKSVFKNILAVILGIVVGSVVNGALITLSPHVFALPEGVDPMDGESIAANIHRFGPANFIMPFLAHALGTLIGAFIAVKLAATHKVAFAYSIGGLFLVGGILNTFMIPAPVWFIAVDLVFAYIPMAWLATKAR